MRIIFFDIDTLRPDHMGCYGYKRNTTPNIDKIAENGAVFEKYYCPNAPCLPSRASLISGKYGIHTGVVGHGGTAADMRLQGESRGFRDALSDNGLFMQFRKAGYHTVSFSTFAERHSAYWFKCGFNESYDVGKGGGESAEEVTALVLDWLERHGKEDNWFIHMNMWDPHTPYRAPLKFGEPFKDIPLCDDWIDDEVFAQHRKHIGPHGAREINMWNSNVNENFPRHPGELKSRDDMKRFIDNYDTGILYADYNIGLVMKKLEDLGISDEELAVIVTSDHGENMGELGLYGEHATADETTCKIPMIISWPGKAKGIRVKGFYDNVDLLPTIRELLHTDKVKTSYKYDGISYAPALDGIECEGKPYIVLTQCAHVCQRSVRFDNYLYMRTIHGGYHLFPKEMLFDIETDPHMQSNLSESRPEICDKAARMILDWTDEMMKTSDFEVDPLWTVLKEGGPLHARGQLPEYIKRLEGTDREYGIDLLKNMYIK